MTCPVSTSTTVLTQSKWQPDMYTNTTKQISEYVRHTYKYGSDETSHHETTITSLAYT